MPKRKKPPEKPNDQFKRFVEAASELGVDKTGHEVERYFEKLAKPKRQDKTDDSGTGG